MVCVHLDVLNQFQCHSTILIGLSESCFFIFLIPEKKKKICFQIVHFWTTQNYFGSIVSIQFDTANLLEIKWWIVIVVVTSGSYAEIYSIKSE